MNKFKKYTYCRFCKSKNIKLVIDLGIQPLAGGFLKNSVQIKKENKYPLQLVFCKNCFLLQTNVVIDKNILFKNYFYSSSKIQSLVKHFEDFSKSISKYYSKNSLILEIGSNDGIFLKILKKRGVKALGVDPSVNLTKNLKKEGINVINDFFSEKIAKDIIQQYGKFDIVTSSNTLAHIEDMNDIVKGIKTVLKENGILIFENHYLLTLLKEFNYDMIYHEHQYYYSLLTLSKFFQSHNMEIFDAEEIKLHGGSIRVFVQNKTTGKYKISKKLNKLIQKEIKYRLSNVSTYKDFQSEIEKKKDELVTLLKKLKQDNNSIVGYGASGRGTVVSNFCDLNNNLLEYVVDDSELKQGYYTPGNHLKILSPKKLHDADYALVFAWAFIDEIRKRNKHFIKKGGKFILPLPKVKIIK